MKYELLLVVAQNTIDPVVSGAGKSKVGKFVLYVLKVVLLLSLQLNKFAITKAFNAVTKYRGAGLMCGLQEIF